MIEQYNKNDNVKCLIVNIGDHYFGALVNNIADVNQRNPTTPIPMANKNIIGVLNSRGHIVTEINVAHVLGIEPNNKDVNEGEFCIVVKCKNEMYSMVFDGIGDVIDIPQADIEKLPDTINRKWFSYSQGVYRLEKNIIVILNFDWLIEDLTPKRAL